VDYRAANLWPAALFCHFLGCGYAADKPARVGFGRTTFHGLAYGGSYSISIKPSDNFRRELDWRPKNKTACDAKAIRALQDSFFLRDAVYPAV